MKQRRIPTWLLERALLGEVPADRADEVREILERDPDERARLAELERSNAEILAELPPAAVAAEVARRAALAARAQGVAPPNGHPAPRARRRMRVLSGSFAVAAGAVVVAVAVGRQVGWPDRAAPLDRPVGGPGEVGPEVTQVKGDPMLLLHRKRGAVVERLAAGQATARAGDRLQISYRAGGARHGVILSLDGAGGVTLHFPALAGGSTRLAGKGLVSLDHSYELDDAPGFERFWFLTAAEPIDVASVLAAAESLARDPQRAAQGRLALPPELRQLSYTLRKETAP
jgi:hypothetical protein